MSARVHAATAFVLGLLVLRSTAPAASEEPPTQQSAIRLKDGNVLRGRLLETVREEGRSFDRVETDFGELRIPSAQVASREEEKPTGTTFVAQEVRILRLKGSVQRRAKPEAPWEALSDSVDYARPPARILPGDTVRTGPDGTADLLLHRDAWMRMAPGTEIEIGAAEAPATLTLLRGRTIHDVNGQPRGSEFRVRTPSTVLGVRGTRFSATASEGRQQVAVLRGTVSIDGGDSVESGRAADWKTTGPPTRADLTPRDRTLLEIEVVRPPPDDMVYIPTGSYLLGSWPNLWADPDAEHGTHYSYGYERSGTVWVHQFRIDRREVSRDEFRRFQRATGRLQAGAPPLEPGTERQPASGMSRDDARAYAHWAGGDLPSATQWEAAARGPDGRSFPWGTARSKTALTSGTWIGGPPEGSFTSIGWQPPARLLGVDAPTADVSPFGVRAMVSSVPEYVRPFDLHEPIRSLLGDNFNQWYRPTNELVRGVRGSVVGMTWRGSASLPAGFRCVREAAGR